MKRYLASLLAVLLSLCVSVTAAENVPPSVIDVLEELGAENQIITPNTRSSDCGDNVVNDPTTTIEFSDTSYAFLDAGERSFASNV